MRSTPGRSRVPRCSASAVIVSDQSLRHSAPPPAHSSGCVAGGGGAARTDAFTPALRTLPRSGSFCSESDEIRPVATTVRAATSSATSANQPASIPTSATSIQRSSSTTSAPYEPGTTSAAAHHQSAYQQQQPHPIALRSAASGARLFQAHHQRLRHEPALGRQLRIARLLQRHARSRRRFRSALRPPLSSAPTTPSAGALYSSAKDLPHSTTGQSEYEAAASATASVVIIIGQDLVASGALLTNQ